MNEKLLKSHFFDLEIKNNGYRFFDPVCCEIKHEKDFRHRWDRFEKRINKWKHIYEDIYSLREHIRIELYIVIQEEEFAKNEIISHHKPRFD